MWKSKIEERKQINSKTKRVNGLNVEERCLMTIVQESRRVKFRHEDKFRQELQEQWLQCLRLSFDNWIMKRKSRFLSRIFQRNLPKVVSKALTEPVTLKVNLTKCRSFLKISRCEEFCRGRTVFSSLATQKILELEKNNVKKVNVQRTN